MERSEAFRLEGGLRKTSSEPADVYGPMPASLTVTDSLLTDSLITDSLITDYFVPSPHQLASCRSAFPCRRGPQQMVLLDELVQDALSHGV